MAAKKTTAKKAAKPEPVEEAGGWQLEQVERVARAIRSLRGEMSAQMLSDRTAELGHRVTRAIIADLETGRRRYVTVHELAMIAAALGVTPPVLLYWGLIPDGDTELIPGRTVSAMEAVSWWGGYPLNPFSDAARSLPRDEPRSAELLAAARERLRLRDILIRSRIGGLAGGDADPAILPVIRDQLAGAVRRIRDLGGVLREDNTETV